MIAWQHIAKEMIAQKLRIILTIFAIAWGTASIAGMLAIGEGLRLTFNKAMQGTGIGVIEAHPGQSTLSYKGRSKGIHVQFHLPLPNKIKQSIPDLKYVSAGANFNGSINYHNINATGQPIAVSPNYADIRNVKLMPGGRFINPLDQTQKKHVVVLGPETYKQLFHNQGNPVGKTVKINKWPFTIIGVSQKKNVDWHD